MRLYDTAELAAISTNLMQRSFTANLMRLEPNGQSPLVALSGMARTRKISAIAHHYWMKQAQFPSAIVSGASVVDETITTIPVDDATQLKTGSLLMYYKSAAGTYAAPELIQVTGISGNNLTVVRQVGGTDGTSGVPDNAVLIEVSTSYEEGSSMPTARAVSMSEYYNYTQIFRDSWDATETAISVALEPDVSLQAENRMDAMFFHANNMEFSTIFGRRGTATRNGKPVRYMDGIESIVTQHAPGNVVAAASTTTFDQLEAMLHPTLETKVNGRGYGPKTLFVGSQAREVINRIGRTSGLYELTPDMTSFGMGFERFRTSRGQWELIEHPLLNAHDATKGMAIVADLQDMDLLWLRETNHKDTAFDGTDAISGVYTSELTMELMNPTGWGIIYDLTAAA